MAIEKRQIFAHLTKATGVPFRQVIQNVAEQRFENRALARTCWERGIFPRFGRSK